MSLQRNPSRQNATEEQNAIQEAVEKGALVDSHASSRSPNRAYLSVSISSLQNGKLDSAELGWDFSIFSSISNYKKTQGLRWPEVSRYRACAVLWRAHGPAWPQRSQKRHPKVLQAGSLPRAEEHKMGAAFLGSPEA